MVKHYYSRYNTTRKTVYSEGEWVSANRMFKKDLSAYSSYLFDSMDGYSTIGNSVLLTDTVNAIGKYITSSDKLSLFRLVEYSSTVITNVIYKTQEKTLVESGTVHERGSFIQSNIVADEGTYPNDGVHTDGYWYVKGSVVNQAPTLTLNTTDNQPIVQDQSITIPETSYQFKITANDEDADQTLQYKVSVGGVNTVPLTSIQRDTETTVTIDKTHLIVGMNAVVATVQDNQGAETTFQFNIIVDANLPIDSSCLANMKFNGYSLSTISLAELVNHLE